MEDTPVIFLAHKDCREFQKKVLIEMHYLFSVYILYASET